MLAFIRPVHGLAFARTKSLFPHRHSSVTPLKPLAYDGNCLSLVGKLVARCSVRRLAAISCHGDGLKIPVAVLCFSARGFIVSEAIIRASSNCYRIIRTPSSQNAPPPEMSLFIRKNFSSPKKLQFAQGPHLYGSILFFAPLP